MPKSEAICIWNCYISNTWIEITSSSTKHNYIIPNFKLLHQNNDFYSSTFKYVQNILNWGAQYVRVHHNSLRKWSNRVPKYTWIVF